MRIHGLTTAGVIALATGLSMAGSPPGISVAIGEIPAGKSIIISHSVTINGDTTATQVSSQGVVLGLVSSPIDTDDPDTGPFGDPTVTGVQQLPTITGNISRTELEDMPISFAVGEFDALFSDPNGDTLQTLRITSLPANGALFRSGGGGAIQPGDLPEDIPRAQITGLLYLGFPNTNGPDQFGFSLSDGVDFAASGALALLNLTPVNDKPLPLPDTVLRYPTQSVKIPVEALLGNDTDIEDPTSALTIISVTSPSANGATVTLSGGRVLYDPSGFTGTGDTFSYTVRDTGGETNSAQVTVNLITDDDATSTLLDSETLGDGSRSLTFAGIPGRVYRVQASETLLPGSWVDIGSDTADVLGRFTVVDTLPIPPLIFYRTVYP